MLYRLEYVRCGKPKCRCAGKGAYGVGAAGLGLHGPYWYAYWTTERKGWPPTPRLHKKYVGKKLPALRDVDGVSRTASAIDPEDRSLVCPPPGFGRDWRRGCRGAPGPA